ncbi:MAG TPA: hypothetical protein VHZ74_04415 [Bryobacteraceae bacterium]|nr:hypothetical protein [Bryobacteraceae bacterium]
MTTLQVIRLWIDIATRFISPEIVAIEWILCALVVLLIWIASAGSWRLITCTGDRFRRVAANKNTAIAISGILPVALRLSLLGVYPVPVPSIHDEFSHLLLADTLAHGRMSNPTHPMWQHFESIHIIQQPTYSSMYPPGQGLFLAAGQVLFHQPWAGVLLSVGLMFAAMCWMMQQWMTPEWAFYGTLLAILRFGIFGPWISGYLGGAVSALGGALLIGSIPALRSGSRRTSHYFLFGLGIVILMNSRPFEGAFITVAALTYIGLGLWRLARAKTTPDTTPSSVIVLRPWIPALVVVACGFAFTGYYSWRVTGSPVRMPYVVNRDTYGWPENLAFLPARTVNIRHKVLRDMHAIEIQRRQILKDWNAFIADKAQRIFENWAFFIGPLLTVPLVFAIAGFRLPSIRGLGLFLALIAFLNLFQLVLYPYHLGPVVGVMFALVVLGLSIIYRRLKNWRAAAGPILALALPACVLCASILKQNADQLGLPLTYWEHSLEPHGAPREAIEHWLTLRSRPQLVVVRYAPDHSPNQEWVYNHADIDGSKVVWAREMDAASDARLLEYFKGREVWLLRADVWPQHVVPYSKAGKMIEEEKATVGTTCKTGCLKSAR